ncbi:MAG: TlpA family protein disulfide reductase [Nannocystales bacterium]
MSQRTATAIMVLWTASTLACSTSAPPAAEPKPPAQAGNADSAKTQDVATGEEIEDVGELRAKRVEADVVGHPAPTPVVDLLDGDSLDLSDVVGRKPVYLKFWATWCVPCREQMPHFEAAQQRYGDDMTIVAVNVGLNESKDAVRDFQRDHDLSMPIGYDADGRVAAAFQVEVTPQHILIDASGSIAYVGHRASQDLDQALAAMSSDHAPTPTPPREAPALAHESGASPLELLDGGSFEVTAAAEQPTVLSFVATWCDWYLADSRPAMSKACIAQQERLNELHATLGSQARFIGVAQSLWTDEDQVRGYQERYGIQFPLALDRGGEWFSRFAVRDVPTTVVLDARGSERLRIAGAPADLETQLAAVLSP